MQLFIANQSVPLFCSSVQLEHALLLYWCRHYDDAWLELALYLERYAPHALPASNVPGTHAENHERHGSVHQQQDQQSRRSAISEEQIHQVQTLLEKVRLQLEFAKLGS